MSTLTVTSGALITAPDDLDGIVDEEYLRQLWQQAEDFGERRRIRSRMYKLREQRLREMVQNDEEALGTLATAPDVSETTLTVEEDDRGRSSTRRTSNIQVTMQVDGNTAVTESISAQNVRVGGLTMRGVDTATLDGSSTKDTTGLSDEEIINEQVRVASQERGTRYRKIIGDLGDSADNDSDTRVSITKSTYSIQSNALAGEGYLSMKNKEVRDSVSPTRIIRERKSSAEEDSRLTSDDETVTKVFTTRTESSTIGGGRKVSREEKSTTKTTGRNRVSEIPVRKDMNTRRVTNKKPSKEIDTNTTAGRRGTPDRASPSSPTKRVPGEPGSRSSTTTTTVTTSRRGAPRETTTTTTTTRTTGRKTDTSKPGSKIATATSARKSKLAEVENRMEASIMAELDKLDTYLDSSVSPDDEVIQQEEEDAVDESGNVVKMVVETRRKKDGTVFTARRVARSTKIVDNEDDINEILIGNPDHEVLERHVTEEDDKDGSKIKIITETRKRPDGIEYTTKNILKTSKIFDYDHPEDVAYCENDELIGTDESEETDDAGVTIKTITETRRKPDGMEYTTKKVYKTSKVKTITPSSDDEIISTKESEETQSDGTIIRTVIETRRTKAGEEYTHRQVYRTRRMTLSGLDLEKGLPMVQNDDELLDKKERVDKDEQGTDIKTITETRRRKDGSTYTFEYVLRSFKGAEDDIRRMQPMSKGSSNIPVSSEDEIVNEEVKEEVLEDGTTVKTIIERRRAKDGTEYLRHRIMRIPKMPEPTLQVGSFDDEVLKEEVDEETLDDGTFVKKITERRRSSLSGIQYTLRRKSKVYSQPTYLPNAPEDEIMDESVTEEETDDGAVVTTIIRRQKRPDGTIYTTQNINKTFKSARPIKFIIGDDDEVTDHSVNEEETSDGYIIRTIVETRRRKDGMEYTVERTEKTSKESPEVHISFTGKKPRRPEDVMTVGEPDDTVISREETEEEEDGEVIRTIHETRRRVDGTEYTTKIVMKSTAFIVPEHETSYVVIKPENEDEDPGFFPSPDDEVVYTRKKEEKDDEGNPITVIIETRQNKVTGEKYNITKRVHTTDIYVDEEGEVVKTHTTTSRPKEPVDEPEEDDDVPYGSVSALKSRFAPAKSSPTTTPDTSSKPDRVKTLGRKKFFEDAAKNASPKSSPIKSSPKKPEKPEKPETKPVRRPEDETTTTSTETTSVHLTTEKTTTNAAFEVKLRLDGSEAEVEDIHTKNISYTPKEDEPDRGVTEEEPEEVEEPKEEKPEEDLESPEEEEPKKPKEEDEEPLTSEPEDDTSQPLKEPENEVHSDIELIEEPISDEPEEEVKRPVEKQPVRREIVKEPKKKPTTERIRRKPVEEPKKRNESPRKKPEERTRRPVDDAPKKRAPVPTQKKSSPTESPTRKAPLRKEPQTSPERSPQRSPQRKSPISSVRASPSASPRRGRSPVRSGVSTPREVTPNRQCCKRQHAPEPASPTRPLKSQPKAGLPRKPVDEKPRMNGDIRRTTREPREPKMNGDIHRKPETSRTRRPVDKQPETDKAPRTTTSRPRNDLSRPTRETPRRTTTPSSRSPEKREPTRSTSRPTDNKRKPTTDRTPRSRPGDLDSPKKTTREPAGKPKTSGPKHLEPKEPIVTMPQTPMTEDMKHLPKDDDEDGPMIEDVSFDPDLPAHKAHRPSIVREPSEYHEIEPTDDMEDDVIEPEEEPKGKLPEDESDEPDERGEPRKPGKPGRPGEPGESSEPEDYDKETPIDSEDEVLRKKQPRSEPEKKPKPSDKQPAFEPEDKEPGTGKPRDRTTPESSAPLSDKKRLFEPTKTAPKTEPKSFVRKPSDDKIPDKRRPYERKPSEDDLEPEETRKEPEELKKPRDRSLSPDSHDEEPRRGVRKPEEEEPVEEEPIGVTRKPVDECVPTSVPDDKKPKHTKLSPREVRDLESEVIPDSKTPNEPETKRKSLSSRYSPVDKKEVPRRKPSYEIKQSVSSKRSMFEQPKEEPAPSPVRRPLFKTKEPEKPKDSKPKEEKPIEPKGRKPLESKGQKEPVKEPPFVKKHVYPLGSDDEDEEPRPKPVVEEDIKLKSSALVMQATKPTDETDRSPRRPKDKEPDSREPREREPRDREPIDREPRDSESDEDVPRDTSKAPTLEDKRPTSRERSPFSKESSPFNKESSPKPFTKEGSPGRFLTGRPIDQGINQTKLRRLDRSNSNKKLYEDLEVPKNQLPDYLENVETITDATVLEIMLEKATSYEERRIIRGQLRILKRPGRAPATTSAPSSTTTPTYKRFVDMTPTRTTTLTTPTTSTTTTPSSPLPSRRPAPTTDKDKDKPTKDAPTTLSTTRKPLSKSQDDTPQPAHDTEPDQPQETPQAPSKPKEKKPEETEPEETEPVDSKPEESKPDDEPLPKRKEKVSKKPEPKSVDSEPKSDAEEPADEPREPSSDLWEPTDSSEAFAPVRPRFGRPEPLEPYISGRSYSPRRSRFHRDEPFDPSSTPKESEPTREEPSEPKDLTEPEPTPKPTSEPTLKKTPEPTREPETTRDEPKPKTKPAAEVPKTSSVPQPKVISEPYSEPLRHQTRHDRTAPQPQKKEQTDVDKIVSAYGVGPTDENGVPLFGLRALRRKAPTSTEPTDQPESSTPSRRPEDEDEPKDKKDEFEPTDSTGRPLFGLRGLRKITKESDEEVTEEDRHYSRATLEKASLTTESSRLVSSVTRQQTTHAVELVKAKDPKVVEVEEEVVEEVEDLPAPVDDEDLPRAHHRESFIREADEPLDIREPIEPSRPGKAQQPEDEGIPRRSRPLRDIIKMHEKKVTEPTAPTETRTTPSRRLRDNFEPETITTENRVTKTWDLESDLSTRSQDVRNIIAHHENIVTEDEPSPKPSSTTTTTTEKKLTGILKKTSTTSVTSNIEEFRTELRDDERPESEPLGSTGDILEALTEDQITRLSQEFDRRAQDDGVITSDHIEEDDLTGRKPGTAGYRVSRRPEGETPDGEKFVRKTSYTEITLSAPEVSPTGSSTTAHAIESSRLGTYSSSSTSAVRSSYSTARESSSSHQVLDSGSITADMREGRSFLDDRSKVTGIGDVISRMGATEAVDTEAPVTSDDQARSLLNRFLGAQVLMSGVESMMANSSLSESSRALETSGGEGKTTITRQAEGKSSFMTSKDGKITDQGSSSYSTGPITITSSSSSPAKALVDPVVVKGVNIVDVQDSDKLNQLLDSCEEYEDRRRIRMRLKSLMAEKKALREELLKHHDLDAEDHSSSNSRARGGTITTTTSRTGEGGYRSSSEDAAIVRDWLTQNFPDQISKDKVTGHKSTYGFSSSSTSSSMRSSSTIKDGTTTTTKNVSPFQKFKQMDANSSPRSTSTKKEGGGGPLFQFSSSLNRSASGVKDMLLQWCQCRTRDYKGVKIENFSTSWNDGMAFCALIHHFYPDAFDFDKLQPQNRRYNFDLAFRVAEEKAGVMPLLDVEDMVIMKKPDWKCVFTYVQSLYKRLKDQ